MKSKNVLNKVVNVCSKVVGERQEHLSQLYEHHVVWKARVSVNKNSQVLVKYYELLPSGRRFCVPISNLSNLSAVSNISEQINLFKCQSSVCECVCVCV